MKKQVLRIAIGCALMGTFSGIALASPVDNPADKAYVERTAKPDQAKAEAEAPTAGQLAPFAPQAIRLVDAQVTPEAAALYQYLVALPQSGHVLYGHQNDVHHKMFRVNSGTNSDTKDVTGSIAGMVGMDSLSLTGAELRLTDADVNTGVTCTDKLVKLTENAVKEGAIITFSVHMPNFDQVAKKGMTDGKYDYSGYSPNVLSGNVAHRILPGGDLNAVYTGYLDIVADYLQRLENKKIPVIFRPFHEQNGSWFWWGKNNASEQDFKALWRYTITYMRDMKKLHNLLYAYSPNGPFVDEASYLDRYPGDKYVDIMGIDSYDDSHNGIWYENMRMSLKVMDTVAKAHGKVIAITEAGVRNGGSLAVSGNSDKKWFSKLEKIALDYKVPYFMIWANFEKLPHNFFEPYMVSDTRGHEMINEFVGFYNDPATIFADGVSDFSKLPAPVVQGY